LTCFHLAVTAQQDYDHRNLRDLLSQEVLIMADTRTLALLIGASQFPNSPNLGNGDAFENSAQDFRQYLHDPNGLNLPAADVLNLFDDDRPAGTLLDLIIEFLNRRQSKKTSTNVERLLVYYVGHGGFTPVGQEYFLAVRSTRERNEGPSSIRISDLGHIIRDNARFLCQYLILDCCFSAQAYSAFQSGPGDAAVARTLDSVPRKGTALLCSSGPKEVSLAPEGCDHTMFSEALLKSLKTGDCNLREFLSLTDIGSLIERNLRDVYENERVRPQVQCPNQPEGDLSDLPIFPNPAFKSRSTEWRRIIPVDSVTARLPDDVVAATNNALPSIRQTALKELVDLFKSTSSPQLAELARMEISKLSEQDDSSKVRMSAAAALLECALVVRSERQEETNNTIADGMTPTLDDVPQPLSEQETFFRAQLAIAGSIQKSLMRVDLPDLTYAKVKAASHASFEIGGDFFDTVRTDSSLSLIVTDVSGKGISAALVSSLLQGIFYSQLSGGASLPMIMAAANRFLLERVGGGKYATGTIVRIQPDGALELVNYGGVRPLLISGTSVKVIEEGSLPIGLIANAEFETYHLQLKPGDRLLLTTDGVSETEDSDGEFMGDEQVKSSIVHGFAALEDAIAAFRGTAPLMDDYTLAELIYTGELSRTV
jgi:Stage II sporulation protein E (SpoIIE)/Caspase domain